MTITTCKNCHFEDGVLIYACFSRGLIQPSKSYAIVSTLVNTALKQGENGA